MVNIMATAKRLNVEEIISKNPKVNRDELIKAIAALKELDSTGAVRRSGYELETPDHSKVLRHSEEDVCIRRGATIRLAK